MAASYLSEDEIEKIILALANGSARQGDGTFSNTDLEAVSKWAQEARFAQITLDLVLSGDVLLRVEDGEVLFSAKDHK